MATYELYVQKILVHENGDQGNDDDLENVISVGWQAPCAQSPSLTWAIARPLADGQVLELSAHGGLEGLACKTPIEGRSLLVVQVFRKTRPSVVAKLFLGALNALIGGWIAGLGSVAAQGAAEALHKQLGLEAGETLRLAGVAYLVIDGNEIPQAVSLEIEQRPYEARVPDHTQQPVRLTTRKFPGFTGSIELRFVLI